MFFLADRYVRPVKAAQAKCHASDPASSSTFVRFRLITGQDSPTLIVLSVIHKIIP